jgi:predicted PurR-regulated permease PerM
MEKIQKYSFLALLTAAGLLMFFIFRPYLTAMLLGAVLAVVFSPVFKYFEKILRGRGALAALLVVFLALLVVLIPASILGTRLLVEAGQAYGNLDAGGVNEFFNGLALKIASVAPQLSIVPVDMDYYIREALNWLVSNLGVFFSGIATAFLNIALALFTMFFFLKNSSEIRKKFALLSPFPQRMDEDLLERLERAANSTIKGTLIVALVQGALAGLGFVIFGLPQPFLWALVATLSALIPAVGTSLVVVPASIYLFVAVSPAAGILNIVWGFFAVGTIDNYLRPKLMEKGVDAHPFIVLLGILGGINLFGPIGFIIGPLAVSLFFALLEMYPKMFSVPEK